LWQNLKPSIEAVIVRGKSQNTEVLLGRRTLDDGRIGWDLPGGFLNANDRLHDALRRECLREMGVEIEVDDLLGAFEDDFYGTRIVCLTFVCTIVGGEPRAADIIDGVEWFRISALPDPASPAVGEALAALRRRALGA
jgi:8-oxo-dGTP diphosphatase